MLDSRSSIPQSAKSICTQDLASDTLCFMEVWIRSVGAQGPQLISINNKKFTLYFFHVDRILRLLVTFYKAKLHKMIGLQHFIVHPIQFS